MRKVWITPVMALLAMTIMVDVAMAQPRGGGGGRGGFGFGGFGGNQGETIADALVLKKDRADKVIAIVEEVDESMREERMALFQQFRDGDRDQMMTQFQELRDKSQKAILAKLDGVLSKEEIEFVKPVMEGVGGRPQSELRALRQIELDDATRGKAQTVVLIYMHTIAENRPEFTPGQRGQRGGQGGPPPEFEAYRKKVEEAQATMVKDLKATLSADQNSAWEKQIAVVEKEMEEQRLQRGQRGGFGGGQGGQRGGGQGGGRGGQN